MATRRKRGTILILAISLLCVAATLPPVASGSQEPGTGEPLSAEAQQEAYSRIVTGMMSPFCPGRTLEACPTSSAAEVRAQVRKWLAAGLTEQSIVDRLVGEWGEDMRGAPKFVGIGRLAWIGVPIVLLVGGAIVLGLLRRTRGGPPEADERRSTEIPDDERRRLEALVERELGQP